MKEKKQNKTIRKLTKTQINKLPRDLFIFKTALLQRNIGLLATVLHEQFTYFDNKSKRDTLAYFKEQFQLDIPGEYYSKDAELSFCMACKPGNPSLVFHKGYWPKPEGFNYPKGLMLSFKNGLICDLTFCFQYCKPDNMERFSKSN